MPRFVNNYETITCSPVRSQNIGKGKGPADRDDVKRMTGGSEPKKAGTDGNTQFHEGVTIDRDMPGASTSAVLKSECHTVNVTFLLMLGIN